MKVNDFITKAREIQKLNTVYATGMFGQNISDAIINSKKVQYPKNYNDAKVKQLRSLVNKNFYGFDCLGFIKSILWGFPNTKYLSNNVSDFTEMGMMTLCTFTSNNFADIVPGAVLYMRGHVGIYLGNGEVAECTAKWSANVLISKLGNIDKYKVGNYRIWEKWGKLKYVDYSETPTSTNINSYSVKKGDTLSAIAKKYNTSVAELAKYNKIPDVNMIYVGQVIKIPTKASTSTTVAKERTYTVQKGEGLYIIAKKVYGNGNRYPEIKKLNGLKDNTIYTGQVLKY